MLGVRRGEREGFEGVMAGVEGGKRYRSNPPLLSPPSFMFYWQPPLFFPPSFYASPAHTTHTGVHFFPLLPQQPQPHSFFLCFFHFFSIIFYYSLQSFRLVLNAPVLFCFKSSEIVSTWEDFSCFLMMFKCLSLNYVMRMISIHDVLHLLKWKHTL